MKPDALRILALCGAIAAAIACVSPDEAVGDPAAPRRIVSLTPALTEILFAIDAGDRVVGVTDYCDYPPEAKARAKVGGYVNPSVEAVLALKPDLVVVSPGPGNRDAVLAMQRARLKVALFPSETLQDSLAAVQNVAIAAGSDAKGRELATRIRERLDAVARRVARWPRVRTLFCLQTEPVIAAGQGTLPSELVEIAGGKNVVEATRYPRMDIEAVTAAKPELILQSRMDIAHDDGGVERKFWDRWPSIPAVAAGRIVILPDDLTLRPGPRVADAAEELVRLLHGDDPAGRTP